MERVSFEIERQDIADALHAEAEAHGRSVEAELAALVEKTYSGKAQVKVPDSKNWVAELIALAQKLDMPDGIEPFIPSRSQEEYEPPKL